MYHFAILWLGVALAAPAGPGSLRILSGGWPRAFFFRSTESMAANDRISYEDWEKTFERLMGIEGKVLEEEVPGRSLRNIEFFTRFKQRHPEQLVLLHYNGNARDPLDQQGKFFAGHWLYYNGAQVLTGVPAEAGETEIRVSDARLFRTGIGRYQRSAEDVVLCESAGGKPDWSRAEQVKLVSVDVKAGVIRVRRGMYGTAPRAFAAGRAWAAAHVYEGPWGEKSNLMWAYNYSLDCPRDPAGRNCADVLVADLVEKFNGPLAAFDGLEFDVLKHTLNTSPRGGRRILADARSYAAGVTAFLRKLGGALGERRLIMADGWNPNNQRSFGLLNGIEAEGWPALTDFEVRDWSGGMNRQAFWAANSRPPAFSYVNHKFNAPAETPGVRKAAEVPFSIDRLVFAGAVFTDSAICYSNAPKPEPGERYGVWDELWAGREHRPGWLGKPLGPAVRLALRQPDLLRGRARVERTKTGVRIANLPPAMPDLVLAFRAKAPAATGIYVGPARSLAWVNQREFEYVYAFPDWKGGALEIEVEDGAPVEITAIRAYAHADAVYREFEHGLVLANPGPRPYTFPLAGTYRRLRGSPGQDPAVNNGQAVSGPVTLPPHDALFLSR
ncbi:MAG: hypothetical protein ACE15B_16025 [Bryobacteraceae bacterium]